MSAQSSATRASTWFWVAALVAVASAFAHVPAFGRLDQLDRAATVRDRQT